MRDAKAQRLRKLEALLAHYGDCQAREANHIAEGDGEALLELLALKGELLETLLPMTCDPDLDDPTRQRLRATLEQAAIRQRVNLEALGSMLTETRAQIVDAQQGSLRLRRLQQQCPTVQSAGLPAALWA